MLTKAGLKRMYIGGLNGHPTKCKIKRRCYTHVFKFPRIFLQAEMKVAPLLIAKREQSRATVVSDLKSYFEEYSPFHHYSISPSFRHKVEEVEKEEVNSRKDGSSLFVVIEQEIPCETIMDENTCFIISEEFLQGGLSGREIIMTMKTSDSTWPEEEDSVDQFVDMILTAIRIEQRSKDPIKEVFSRSCFFDIDGRMIYIQPEPIVSATLVAEAPTDDEKLRVKADRLQKLINGLEEDIKIDIEKNKRTTLRLVEALGFDRNKDDYYRYKLYLALYTAMERKLESHDSKTGDSKLSNFTGKHGNHRVELAHPEISVKVNRKKFRNLLDDILKELRDIYET
ncbi:MAG: hypothetical protein F4235_05895 [Candidatus Dadabacteria bacterium]|nr:hypothetical protein [Candidatus Dadabacteria bacterium]MYE61554.1 hypothetical protein [Candidatus Dadabacteria bacterium]